MVHVGEQCEGAHRLHRTYWRSFANIDLTSPILEELDNTSPSNNGRVSNHAEQDMHIATPKVSRLCQSNNCADDTLSKALDVVTDDGIKVKAVLRKFGIPTTSLMDHLYGKTTFRQRGNFPILKLNQEKKLVDYIFKMRN